MQLERNASVLLGGTRVMVIKWSPSIFVPSAEEGALLCDSYAGGFAF